VRDSTSRKVTANTRHTVICVTEESSTGLVQFQALEVNGRGGRQTPCVFVSELVSGCHFNSEAGEGSSPAYHGPLIVPYHINFYDPAVRAKCVIIKLFKNFPAKYLKRTDILSMTINFFVPTVLRGTQQSMEGNRYVTRISNNACVISLQSRALLLTNHNHPALISQLLRHQEIAHNASSIHGCVVVENKDSKVGFQDPFDEWVCLKRIITTVGSVRFVYVQTQLKTAEELIYIVFWNIKILVK